MRVLTTWEAVRMRNLIWYPKPSTISQRSFRLTHNTLMLLTLGVLVRTKEETSPKLSMIITWLLRSIKTGPCHPTATIGGSLSEPAVTFQLSSALKIGMARASTIHLFLPTTLVWLATVGHSIWGSPTRVQSSLVMALKATETRDWWAPTKTQLAWVVAI